MTALVRLLLVGILLCGAGLGYVFVVQSQNAGIKSDNTTINKQDLSFGLQAAKHQTDNSSDREITRTILRDIVRDKTLSTYAHNIKVFTQAGKVTLLGPARSEAEKKSIHTKAVGVAGRKNISNQLDVVN